VRNVVADEAARGLAKGQTIEVDADQQHWAHVEASLLSMLVRNLVDNAIRYSPPGAAVRVTVQNAHSANGAGSGNRGGVSVLIEDSGPGMRAPDMQRLGERFFRVMGTGQSGSGLGWSITRRIAAVVGADTVVSRSASLGGLAVKVALPADPAVDMEPPAGHQRDR